MRGRLGRLAGIAAALLLAAAAGGCRTGMTSTPRQRADRARAIISDWAEPARLLAAKLLDEYGPPDRLESGRLVWNDQRLWKRISVWDELPGLGPGEGGCLLEETVSYPVPARKRPDLAAFSGDIRVSVDGTELSARSLSEERNALAVDLADEIVKGIKTPDQARRFYDHTLRL
ncbi:MAG: hypothetical protein NTY77_05845 [Elusimicrobia bacterium]|nr:hypothetical protein [Elusimicrobiota bacterium]